MAGALSGPTTEATHYWLRVNDRRRCSYERKLTIDEIMTRAQIAIRDASYLPMRCYRADKSAGEDRGSSSRPAKVNLDTRSEG